MDIIYPTNMVRRNCGLNLNSPLFYGLTFSGETYFDRMKKLGLYNTDVGEIKERIGKKRPK